MQQDIERLKIESKISDYPSICIITGDIIFGSDRNDDSSFDEIREQYEEAVDFLNLLTDKIFNCDKNRVVLLPGNHDICYRYVDKSLSLLETTAFNSKEYYKKSKSIDSLLRWSFDHLSFLKINNIDTYNNKFLYFSDFYKKFYGDREYPLDPEKQFDFFDYPDQNITVGTLNSCYNTDKYRTCGAFNTKSFIDFCKKASSIDYSNRILIACWHHNLLGSPLENNYLDNSFIQYLIDREFSIGLYGHQHISDCYEERSRYDNGKHKIITISAGSLCAGPNHLSINVNRGYNIIALDTEEYNGKVYKRDMKEGSIQFPTWIPGKFNQTNSDVIDFSFNKRIKMITNNEFIASIAGQANDYINKKEYIRAIEILENYKSEEICRRLFIYALGEIDDYQFIAKKIKLSKDIDELILYANALSYIGDKDKVVEFLQFLKNNNIENTHIKDVAKKLRGKFNVE